MQLPTRRQLTLLLVLLSASFSFSQSQAVVTGNVSSITGTTATSGIVQFTLAPFSTAINYRVNGVTVLDPIIAQCSIDSSGNIKDSAGTGSCLVWGNDNITPANTCYQVGFNPNGAGYDRVLQGVRITGATVDLSSPTFCTSVRITPEIAVVATEPINSNIIPAVDNFFNLGGPQNRYSHGYFSNLDVSGGTCNGCGGITGVKIVDGISFTTIQSAITAAGTTGSVLIAPTYTGTDTYTNPNKIQITDLRGKPNRDRGFINMLTDCGLKGDGVTDDLAAAQACFDAFQGYGFLLPKTVDNLGCSYRFSGQLVPKGDDFIVEGTGGGFRNFATNNGGTVLCFDSGATGFLLDITYATGGTIRDLNMYAGTSSGFITDSTLVSLPSGTSLPQFTRAVLTSQRTANVLSVTITAAGGQEGLTQLVGSQVLLSNMPDSSMNGRCIIATLTNLGTFSENPQGFTCAQNGPDAGPFGAVGSVLLATAGAQAGDGVRVCGNFFKLENMAIKGFSRHGINADSQPGHGCAFPFSDDLRVTNVETEGNQADGIYCQGTDCNVNVYTGVTSYYNLLWCIEDNSSLGNAWYTPQLTACGAAWVGSGGATPATKAISTVSRTLSGGTSTVTGVLSAANTSVKQGSCIVIAGVTDSSFNTPAGQCYFVTAYTDSTHFQWEQPGAPANASSSGGTARLSKFNEMYLSSGVDSGAAKVGTQSPSSSTIMLYAYVEGGALCKLHTYVISIGGPTGGCNTTQSTWVPSFLNVQGSGSGGLAGSLEANIRVLTDPRDTNYNLNFRAGLTAARDVVFQWMRYDNAVAWTWDVGTSGTNGDNTSAIFGRNGGIRRLGIWGPLNSSGVTILNSESVGPIRFNTDNGSGTGGELFGDGAGNTVASISSAGLGTFNGGVIGASLRSQTANVASAGAVRLAKTDAIQFRNNANGGDISALSLNASDQLVAGAPESFPAVLVTGLSGAAVGNAAYGFSSNYNAAFFTENNSTGTPVGYQLSGHCSGTATAGSTLAIFGLGENSALTCTAAYAAAAEQVLAWPKVISSLRVKAGTAGTNASSGVFTVLKNNVATSMTCTVGTSTTCSDANGGHAFAAVAGDSIGVKFTTQAAETLADLSVGVQ